MDSIFAGSSLATTRLAKYCPSASTAVLMPFRASAESSGAALDVVEEVVVLFDPDTVVVVVVVVEPSAAAIPSTFSMDGARLFPSEVRLLPTDFEAASSCAESELCVTSISDFA